MCLSGGLLICQSIVKFLLFCTPVIVYMILLYALHTILDALVACICMLQPRLFFAITHIHTFLASRLINQGNYLPPPLLIIKIVSTAMQRVIISLKYIDIRAFRTLYTGYVWNPLMLNIFSSHVTY